MTDQTPATATEARTVLDARVANPEWGARLLAGDATAINELHLLTGKIDAGGADVVQAIIDGKTTTPDGGRMFIDRDQQMMAGTAEMFRSLGIRDVVTAEFLSGKQVTKEEYDAVAAWKRVAMGSKVFTDAYLAGDIEARQKMTIANSVLVNGIAESAAA
jgi:hypothetical protein